ncbi:MAG: hypothetical protein K5897_09855 [Eubacterium sp.]|nr:hypothetical protein [Eubacterium sp.]
MERAIDKFILYVGALYVMSLTFGKDTQPFYIYFTLAFTAAMLWLIPGESDMTPSNRTTGDRQMWFGGTGSSQRPARVWAACLLLDAAVVLIFLQPGFLGVLPLLVYDLILCRHWVGLGLSGIAMINAVYLLAGKGNEARQGIAGMSDTRWYPTLETFGIVLLLLGLSVWLCLKSLQVLSDRRRIKQLRDDAAETQQTLSRQNAQLLEARDSEVVTAQLAERNRIAREIHDNVGHTLSRALLQVGALLAIHKEEPVHGQLSGVRETLDSAMNNIRSSVHDLHDSSVDLEGTVRQMAEPLQEAFQVTIEIDVSGDMPRETKYGLIGILREAISNILRHSRNDTVQISVLEHPGFYQMIVYDHLSEGGQRRTAPVTGKESATPGIGLTNIETRARSMGGTVQITEEDGFRVFVSVPKH